MHQPFPVWEKGLFGACAKFIAKHNGGTLDGYTFSKVHQISKEAANIIPCQKRPLLAKGGMCFCTGICFCASQVIVEYDIRDLESVVKVLME